MNIYLPMNAVIIPIVRNEKTHYFFLDTGFPISFTIVSYNYIKPL